MKKTVKHYYERNTKLVEHPVNKYFEEILWMTDEEFVNWFTELRTIVVDIWDDDGIPPRVGYNKEGIEKQFRRMSSFKVHEFETVDVLTGEKDVIRNTSAVGNAANQWFPTMMKTRINYKMNDDGLSIYDHFADPKLLEKTLKYARRHFKKDSFYAYSAPIFKGQTIKVGTIDYKIENSVDFINWFEETARQYDQYDYWLKPIKEDKKGYTGYNDKLRDRSWLSISRKDIEKMPDGCKTNVEDYNNFEIMLFEKRQRIFPVGLKAFRVSWCQYAVNFPPLTAKYLYEKYTEHFKTQDMINIYDPSSGWGGRILGAMSIKDDRNIHYIGTDPNTDHSIENGRTKYEDLADTYNSVRNSGVLFTHENTYDMYQLGSEVIHENEDFQKYKGKLDLIFTSPPYFAKEAYCEDDTQSYKKFNTYDVWRDGFLRPTLETCVEYLRSDRYLLWNIADAKFGKDMLPLEKDSIDILESLGMKFVTKLKMSLAQMPGGNRIDTDTGLPKAKNFCKVNDIWLKYEPVYVFYKE